MIKPIEAARRIHKDKHSENRPEKIEPVSTAKVQSSTVVSIGKRINIGYENIHKDAPKCTAESIRETTEWFKQL